MERPHPGCPAAVSQGTSHGGMGGARATFSRTVKWCRTPSVCGLNLGTRERDSRCAPKACAHDKDLRLGGEPGRGGGGQATTLAGTHMWPGPAEGLVSPQTDTCGCSHPLPPLGLQVLATSWRFTTEGEQEAVVLKVPAGCGHVGRRGCWHLVWLGTQEAKTSIGNEGDAPRSLSC